MKCLFSFLLLSFSFFSKAQTFKGEWEGVYITSDSSFWENIKLVFEWHLDSGYRVKSYTAGKNKIGEDTIIVCQLDYKLLNPSFLLLSEVQILTPIGINPGICFQTMELKYYPRAAHKSPSLIGKWQCADNKSKGSGFMRLEKIYK